MKWNFRFSNFFDLVSFLFQSSMMPYLKMTKLVILNQCDISKFFILCCVFILGEILIHCECLHHQERIGVEGRKIHAFHLQKRITQTHKTFGLQKNIHHTTTTITYIGISYKVKKSCISNS